MKIKTAIIVFPGTTSAQDLKKACNYFEWDTDFIWHKDNFIKKYDIIFLPGGLPYGSFEFNKNELTEKSNILNKLPISETLIVGFSEGFRILCEMNLLKGSLNSNINDCLYSGIKEFTFLDNNINLPVSTYYGNFTKNQDFNEDIILKYSDNSKLSENKIAGIFDYENKVIGMTAKPELAVLPQLKHFDGRKVFEFLKNVI